MGWVLSCETVLSEVPIHFTYEKATSSHALERRAWDGPRAVGDPMHVETSFDRNLGDLIPARRGMPGRVMEARAER